jgi:DNA-binding transcriptional MerR regulator
MLKIGDFSKISRCTVKTLRYYSDIGLLEPIHIDQFTGYRYYSPSQLLVTAKILRLKSIGFTLQQIKQVLLSVEAPQDMFEMLQKQLLITKKEVSAA